MDKRLFFLLAFMLSLSQEIWSQTFTVEQAVEYALENNANVKNSQTDIRIASAQKNEIRGLGLPQITASVDVRDYLELPTNLIPADFFGGEPGTFQAVQFGTKYNATAGFNASQLLFSGDYIVALQAASTYLDLSTQNSNQTKIETSVAVEKAYYNVLINEERFELLQANVERLEQTLSETERLFDAGFVEKIDADRLKVAFNNLSVEKNNVGKLLQLGKAMLKFQMGMPQSEEIELSSNLEDVLLENIQFDREFEFTDRADYRLISSQLELAKQDLRRYQMGYVPNIMLYGNLSAQAQRNEFNFFQTDERWFPITFVGATISANIFDGLQRENKVQQAKLEIMKTETSRSNFEEGIQLEEKNTRIQLENSLASMEAQKENMELAKSVLETTNKKYKAGTATSLEVTEAEGELKEAQTNYLNALYNAIVAKLDFDKATGRIIIEK